MRLLSCLCVYFLTLQTIFTQADTIVLPDNLNTIEWQFPLLNHALVADNIPLGLGFNDVQNIDFQPFTKDSVFIKDDKCAWLHFKVKNPNPADTLLFFVSFNTRIHKVYLFSQVGEKIDSIAGGRLTDYYKRPFRENKACFPLKLPPQYVGSFWLKFNNFSENRSNLYAELVSVKTEEKMRLDESYTYLINSFLEVIYLSFFALLSLFSARMAYIWLDEGYKWYAIYMGSFFVFYFRDFENYNSNHVFLFSYFSSWHFEIETTIVYVTCISYMIFIQKFLDLKQFHPRFNRQATFAIRLIIAFSILDLIVHAIWGLAVSFRIFIYVRLVFFIFYFIILIQIAYNTSSSLSRFIILGTLCMLLPGITSNISVAFGGDTHAFGYGFFWLYEFPTFKLPMFGTRLGILLEACFFLYGLSWKARREYDELKKLKSHHDFQVTQPKSDESNTPLSEGSPFREESFGLDSNEITERAEPQIIETHAVPIEGMPTENGEKQDKEPDTRVKQAFSHLENDFKNPDFNVKKWGQTVYLSTSHFSKLMTEETHEPPSSHIQRRRLQYAQQLMLTTDFQLAQIALESGYSDSNYFSRIFKKTFQQTPSEWQKLHKKG